MIAIDTNVLLRYLLQDDKRQSAQATTLLKAGRKVLITDVVLAESVWTLKGKKYQLSKEKIIDIVHALFSEPAITFEDNQAVWCALKDYADALIVNKAKRFGHVKGIEIESVYTFDQAALCFDGTEELQ